MRLWAVRAEMGELRVAVAQQSQRIDLLTAQVAERTGAEEGRLGRVEERLGIETIIG